MKSIQTVKIDVVIPQGQTMYITPLADVHADARACDHKALDKMLKEREKLGNHHLLFLGDMAEYILPSDPRYAGGNPVRLTPDNEFPGDDTLDEIQNWVVNRFDRYNILASCSGNHPAKIAKKHGTMPTKNIAKRLGVPYVGYKGRLLIRMFDGKHDSARNIVRILFHHGAWGGKKSAGFGGAMDWAAGYPGWDLLLFGHNHMSDHHWFDVDELNITGKEHAHTRHVVACGTFLQTALDDYETYSDQKGYAPIHVGSPLVKLKQKKDCCVVTVEGG